MKRKINIYGNDVLRKKSYTVCEFGEKLHKLVDDMFETMYGAEGVGLAAPQIGISESLCVVDSYREASEKLVLINPEIIAGEGEIVGIEGCLSVPEISGEVKRYEKICVKAQDIHGNKLEFEAYGFLARIIQHETDHLNGVLFVDRLSPVRKILITGKLKKIMKEASLQK